MLPSQWLYSYFKQETAYKKKETAENVLSNGQVDIKVILDSISISASDALTLKKGEVIQFDHNIYQPMQLIISSSKKVIAQCNLGKSGEKRSIIIS